MFHGGGGGRGGGGNGSTGEEIVGFFDALPTVVAVHGPEAAGHGGDAAVAELADLGLNLREVAEGARRRRVAAIGEGVDKHAVASDAVGLGLREQAVEVFQHAMHAAIGDDAHQVKLGGGGGLDAGDGGLPNRIGDELFVGEELVEANEFLINDATRTDIFVADLGVAHLAVG